MSYVDLEKNFTSVINLKIQSYLHKRPPDQRAASLCSPNSNHAGRYLQKRRRRQEKNDRSLDTVRCQTPASIYEFLRPPTTTRWSLKLTTPAVTQNEGRYAQRLSTSSKKRRRRTGSYRLSPSTPNSRAHSKSHPNSDLLAPEESQNSVVKLNFRRRCRR